MAFGKKKNKVLKRLVISLVIVLGALGIGVFGYQIFNGKIEHYKNEYLSYSQSLQREVLISKGNVLAGTIIDEHNFYESRISASLFQGEFVTKEGYGKVLLVDMDGEMPLMKPMIYDEVISHDMREEEINMFLLPSNIGKNHYIDVRIGFPNGEDYIVLSKKKVREMDLAQNTIWLWLDEKEILTLSSGIVDAYLNKGSKLYTVKYVAPAIQDESTLTYPVKAEVLDIIKSNPNILEEAKKNLTYEARKLLDERLSQLTDQARNSVDEGIKQEARNREDKIMKEQEKIVLEQSNNHNIDLLEIPEDAGKESDKNKEEDQDESFF